MDINSDKFKKILTTSAVPVLFLFISAIAIPISRYTGSFLLNEIITRLSRNSFLVIALLLPVMAGMGINFGMILGAMAGQIGLIFVLNWGVGGALGLLLAALVATPISIFMGWFAGQILNKAKGREMITSMILGLFTSGIYQFILLFLFGSVIPFDNPILILSRGFGVRNALSLKIVSYGFDNLLPIKLGGISIPVGTFLIISLICLFIVWFKNTKLGQDMRAVGQDNAVSNTAGINVDKTRVQSIMFSTVLACYGQIISLQNIGTLNTYNGADQAALFAAAALLVGGATVSKASIVNATIGTALFHLMFIVVPIAGNNLTGQAQLGEYLRMVVSYAVIAMALVLHAWKRQKDKEIGRAHLRNASVDINKGKI